MKQIVQLGVHYEQTPIKVRECMAFTQEDIEEALRSLQNDLHIQEIIFIQTCNRSEFYIVTEDIVEAKQAVKSYLRKWDYLREIDIDHYLTIRIESEAIEHLFRTIVGLDSLVVGETEILGQIKEAFYLSQYLGCTKKIFNELFKRAIAFGKKIHTETEIGAQAKSVSYVAVNHLKARINIVNKKILVIGAGQTGERVLKNLKAFKNEGIRIMNRSEERGKLLAKNYDVSYEHLSHLKQILKEVDVIISATSSPEMLITKEMIEELNLVQSSKTLIDLAVPRDIDPHINQIASYQVIHLDHFQEVISQNEMLRKSLAKKIASKIDPEITAFENWISEQEAVPIIKALIEKSESIQRTTMQSIERKIPDLNSHEKKVLQKHTKSIVHQLLKDPIAQAKRMSQSNEELATFQEIFGLKK